MNKLQTYAGGLTLAVATVTSGCGGGNDTAHATEPQNLTTTYAIPDVVGKTGIQLADIFNQVGYAVKSGTASSRNLDNKINCTVAQDANGKYTLTVTPDAMPTEDTANCELKASTTSNDNLTVKIDASVDTQSPRVSIAAFDANSIAGLAGIPGTGTTGSLDLSVEQVTDKNQVTYAFAPLPAGFTFDATEKTLSWGQNIAAGTYNLSYQITDIAKNVTEVPVKITVAPFCEKFPNSPGCRIN
jgi:hypothetical protein